MGKIYTKNNNKVNLVQAKPETIEFLLNYSKSLNVATIKGVQYESNMN